MTSELREAEVPADIKTRETIDPYKEWQKSEGVQVIVDYKFEDLDEIELGDWERKGGKGAIINIPSRSLLNDTHLIEIKPGGKSEPEHHMYEETMYVVSGRGATSVWHEDKTKSTFEWAAGSLIVIPLNAWYQHFNGSGSEPARYISMTNAPPMFRLFRNQEFIFNTPFAFKDRFSGDDEDAFNGQGTLFQGGGQVFSTFWKTNFVPNADTMKLWKYHARGAGGINTHFDLAGNVTAAHISEFPVGTYKKGHRHGPGAHLVILGGVGFSMLWWDNDKNDYETAQWSKRGMVIVPADATFHQHFNTGNEPARYLALRPGGGQGYSGDGAASNISITEGGGQVEYENEDPEIHRYFEGELAKHGAECRMKAFIPSCTGVMGPTSEKDT
jgi:mannose-6-phosphate isomerase-like protein (cupin superfamily)